MNIEYQCLRLGYYAGYTENMVHVKDKEKAGENDKDENEDKVEVIRRHYERRGAAVSLFFTTKPCQLSNLSHTSTTLVKLPYHTILRQAVS